MLLWLAVHLCCLLNHVDFLIAADTHNVAIVLNAHKQMTATIVGKGTYRTGYLAGISNLILEILMLMLTLINKPLYIALLFRYHCNCKGKKSFSLTHN